LRNEWLIQQEYSTKEQLDEMMKPPDSYYPHKRIVSPVGEPVRRRLAKASEDYKLIARFMLSNDAVISVLNKEFKRTHPRTSRDGSAVIWDWAPDLASLRIMQTELHQTMRMSVSGENIRHLLQGFNINVLEYQRISVNGTVFCTATHEGVNRRTTRKYLYYRMERRDVDSDGGMHNKVVAMVDKIYLVDAYAITTPASSSSSSSPSPSTYLKSYFLVKVRNYEYAHHADPRTHRIIYDKHESELPHVQPASKAGRNFDALPIINAQDIYPWHIALWPDSLSNPTSARRLVVQIDPITNEFDD